MILYSPDPPTAQPRQIAVDETAVKVNGEWSWLYAAISTETKLILDIQLFNHHGTDPAATFLHGVTEKHDRTPCFSSTNSAAGLPSLD